MKIKRTLMALSLTLLALSACTKIKSRIAPDATQTLLETREVRCAQDVVRVVGLNGGVKISRGESKEIFLDGTHSEVLWYCERGDEADLERTAMPAQTNRLIVSRSVGDAMTLQFYRQTPSPSRDRALLKTAEERCNNDVIRFVGSSGNVEIRRDESKEIPVAIAAGEVIWYCDTPVNGAVDNGVASIKTAVPDQANLIVVTRPQAGNSFIVQFFRK
jgi:hypothetical protein